jgi:hypothetical protein
VPKRELGGESTGAVHFTGVVSNFVEYNQHVNVRLRLGLASGVRTEEIHTDEPLSVQQLESLPELGKNPADFG